MVILQGTVAHLVDILEVEFHDIEICSMLVWKLDILVVFKYVYRYAFALLLSKPLNCCVSVLIEVVQLPDSVSFALLFSLFSTFELTSVLLCDTVLMDGYICRVYQVQKNQSHQ